MSELGISCIRMKVTSQHYPETSTSSHKPVSDVRKTVYISVRTTYKEQPLDTVGRQSYDYKIPTRTAELFKAAKIGIACEPNYHALTTRYSSND